jgi:chromosome segregation ATPase
VNEFSSGQWAQSLYNGYFAYLGSTTAELVLTLEKLTTQHADTLTRAIAGLRAAGNIESAEAEVYAARTSAEQRVATAEARLAEEIQRRRDAEAERDDARADREQADDAAAQAITRIDELERELAEARTSAKAEVRSIRASAATEIKQARDSADRDISAAREHAARQVADAEARAEQAEQDATRARQAEAAAITRAEHAQTAAADETTHMRADHRRALDQLTTATSARISELEETRDALRIRAERAETDLDTARNENQRLTEQLSQAASTGADPAPTGTTSPPRPRGGNGGRRMTPSWLLDLLAAIMLAGAAASVARVVASG